jgi:murein DD-endopeptidase MepM/ murein hydrolase activator NlpD
MLLAAVALALLSSAGPRGGGARQAFAAAPAAAPPPMGAPATSADSSYSSPVPGGARVTLPFIAPATRYGAGHRGVDLAIKPGLPVVAAATGTVRFAGAVAGRGVVVIAHADGVSTEYEPLAVAVRAGQLVRRGQRLGVVSGTHRGCPRSDCLHWGARRGEVYFDPMSLLRPLGAIRLVPADK